MRVKSIFIYEPTVCVCGTFKQYSAHAYFRHIIYLISSLKDIFIYSSQTTSYSKYGQKKYSKPIYNNQYLIYPKINNVLLYLDRAADKTLFTQFFMDTKKYVIQTTIICTIQNDAACFYLPFTFRINKV